MFFSVIVTVYKVESYLKECIDSILAQSFEDFEVVLVDDGSPDGCGAICDAYEKKDKRIKVIHQENKGVAEARKSGLRVAKGAYIIYVDGDDRIQRDFLGRGYAIIQELQADMVVFACLYEYESGQPSRTICEPLQPGLYSPKDVRGQLCPYLLMSVDMKHMTYYVAGKIFLRSLAEDSFHAVKDGISLGEDTLCIIPAYLKARSVYISHEAMAVYRIRDHSGAHGFQIGHFFQTAQVLEELNGLKKRICFPMTDFDRQIQRYGAFMCFTFMIHAANDGQFMQLKAIRNQMDLPVLKESIRQAEFKAISMKTKVTYALLKRNLIFFAYLFLRICRKAKMTGISKAYGKTLNQYHNTNL